MSAVTTVKHDVSLAVAGIAKCLEAAKLLDPLPFEVKGTEKFPCSSAPERARSNAILKVKSAIECPNYCFGATYYT